jgi:hypothetical protein
VPDAEGHSAATEVLLRLMGAALQVSATWAVVRALDPDSAGVYFRGFIIALGMAALLRAKYELYMAHHIIGRRAAVTGICDGVLLLQVGRRVLVRSSLVCGALLVVTADLDIQSPRLQPILETYLPFVLAIPCISIATLIGEALRAANRTLFGMIVSAYAVNLSILLAVAFAPADGSLILYAWAFFGGSLAAAVLAVVLGSHAFPCAWAEGARTIERDMLRGADERELIGFSRAVLQWGPLCILAVAAPAIEMAQYAVAARTAAIVDYFLPALNLSGRREPVGNLSSVQALGPLPFEQLRNALVYSSAFVLVLAAAAPATLRLYGYPYTEEPAVYILLLGMQWANSVGRPAVRHAVVEWDVRRIRAVVGSGALAALIASGIMIGYGAIGIAAAVLIGALLVNALAIASALTHRPAQGHGTT